MSTEVRLDFGGIESEAEFHRLVAGAFSFPGYYGKNKDAFWDCLNDILEHLEVRISGLEEVPPELGDFVSGYIEILKEYETLTDRRFLVRIEP